MAEHILETRIQLRYATYTQWMNSQLILKPGEVAIAVFPYNRAIVSSNIFPDNTPPAVGIKVGDGERYFYQLPWLQAVAADVYNWAKSPDKPTYTASEIQGLDSYIEEHGGGSGGGGSGSSVSRQYQILQGTGADSNKYFLRYKNDDSNTWTVDTNHYIDLEHMEQVYNWIGNTGLGYTNLRTYIGQSLMLPIVQSLAYADSEVENGFVTAVSQTDGIINVTRRRPDFSNLSGSATVEQGGTGLEELPAGEILVGNGTNPVTSIPIATQIEETMSIAPNYLVKAYVDAATAGLTGAMHFVGDATVPITGAVDPRVDGYTFAHAQRGDVILYERKEYVWTGSTWRLLGDEGSYAVKGSIVDADIDVDAAIQLTKIAGLIEILNSKVSKVEGKDLSSNDYTNEDRIKLANIAAGAQVNVIEHVFLNDREILPVTVHDLPKSINLTIKEFEDTYKDKLNSIAAGAQVNVIEHVIVDGEELPVGQDKTVTITTDPHLDHVNKIESIYVNGVEQPPDQTKAVRLVINKSALGLNVIEGAVVPNGQNTEQIPVNANSQLQFARIAKTGEIQELIQPNDTYITLYCGTSTDVI